MPICMNCKHSISCKCNYQAFSGDVANVADNKKRSAITHSSRHLSLIIIVSAIASRWGRIDDQQNTELGKPNNCKGLPRSATNNAPSRLGVDDARATKIASLTANQSHGVTPLVRVHFMRDERHQKVSKKNFEKFLKNLSKSQILGTQ